MNCTLPGSNMSGNVTFLGVAPGVTLLEYRISSCLDPSTTNDIMAEALQMAYEDGADIISVSWGSESYQPVGAPWYHLSGTQPPSGALV